MACDILKGRGLSCKDQRIGIKYIDFVPFAEFGFAVTAQEIATLPSTLTEVFRYIVKGTGNKLVETGTVNLETRTTEIKSIVSTQLQRLGKESEVELMALLYGRVIAFVHDNNGLVHVVGIDSGLDATTAEKSTDTSGYTATLEALSSKFSPYLSTSAKAALEALVSTEIVTP